MNLERRNVIKGAAWGAPVVATAFALPAHAASPGTPNALPAGAFYVQAGPVASNVWSADAGMTENGQSYIAAGATSSVATQTLFVGSPSTGIVAYPFQPVTITFSQNFARAWVNGQVLTPANPSITFLTDQNGQWTIQVEASSNPVVVPGFEPGIFINYQVEAFSWSDSIKIKRPGS